MQEKRSNEDKDDDRRKQTLKKQYRTDRNGKSKTLDKERK